MVTISVTNLTQRPIKTDDDWWHHLVRINKAQSSEVSLQSFQCLLCVFAFTASILHIHSQFKVVHLKRSSSANAVETWKMLLARENLLHIPTCPKSNRGLTIHKDNKPRSELTSTYQPASALLGRGRPVDISFPQYACITFIKANKWRFKVKWRQQNVSTITWVWYNVYSAVGTLQPPVISKCLSQSQQLVQKSTICWDQTSISWALNHIQSIKSLQ